MSKLCRLVNLFLCVMPVGVLYANDRGDREIFPISGDTIFRSIGPVVAHTRPVLSVQTGASGRFVEPFRSSQDVRQCGLRYKGQPRAFERENILISAAKTGDERERIQRTTEWPYGIQGHLACYFNSGHFGGSGVLVGPYHLLTCAHNVYIPEQNSWVSRIEFYPALNDADAPYGVAHVVGVYLHKAWIERADARYEMALLTLDRPIGLEIGYCGLACLDDAALRRETVEVTGYPSDKECKQMWTMASRIETMTEDTFQYQIDTHAGQSGGAIWTSKWGQPYVVGIHTHGSPTGNKGIRLSPAKFDWLVRQISQPETSGAATIPASILTLGFINRL